MIEIIKIEFRDIEYMDYDYDTFYVIKQNDFESKYEQLEKLSKEYESFQEVCDFIYENFVTIDIKDLIIRV